MMSILRKLYPASSLHFDDSHLVMCGIVGEYKLCGDKPANEEAVARMQASIVHRGPNDEGRFSSGSCCLGFRRLSIIDLEGGHQPLANEDETVWVTLNGEIYNFRELRRDLEDRGHAFRSLSDTEVIVHLYEEHGLKFCEYLRGMFAIALFDVSKQRLVLARDRFGIKPLYFWRNTHTLVYGSEIKSLLKHPSVSTSPDEEGIFQFLVLRHSLEPGSMFAGIEKLPAGSLLVADASGTSQTSYWAMPHVTRFEHDPAAAEQQYQESLLHAVQQHLVADVPVGIFLSGGVDSSVVAALAQQFSDKPITCFTAQFHGSHDETEYARAVANHIGADHRAVPIEPPATEILEDIIWHLDEPLGDPACLPTFLLSQEAVRECRVVLSGEGSDETNAGYNSFLRYKLFHDHKQLMSVAKLLWPLLRRLPKQKERFSHYQEYWEEDDELERMLADGWAESCRAGSTLAQMAPKLLHNEKRTKEQLRSSLINCPSEDPLHRFLEFSRSVFLREDLLTKVDRMTMAHGLEARVPYLDHRVAEVAAHFAANTLIRGKRTKSVLRDLGESLLPKPITNRPQQAFRVPLHGWFQGDFGSFASDLLSKNTIARRGILCPEATTSILLEYRSRGTHARIVWNLVLLELWFRRFFD